MNSTNREI